MAIWIEETDKVVWHRVSARLVDGHLPAACGYRMSVRHGRIWMQKRNEPGPPDAERCDSCVSRS